MSFSGGSSLRVGREEVLRHAADAAPPERDGFRIGLLRPPGPGRASGTATDHCSASHSAAREFPTQGFRGGMQKNNPRQQRVPHRPNRVIVAAPTARPLQFSHQRLIWEILPYGPQPVQISKSLDSFPSKEWRLSIAPLLLDSVTVSIAEPYVNRHFSRGQFRDSLAP